MNRKLFVLSFSLLALFIGVQARAGHLPRLELPRSQPAPLLAPMPIPDNVLTGRGAIATPDGVAHF